jgi:hypothetical protein
MSKVTVLALLPAILFLSGCGKEERAEAVRLTHALAEKQADFAKADAIEKEFVANARAWCEGIISNGAGRGVELDQNAAVATELAKNLEAASADLGAVRQAVYDQPLKKDNTQSLRAGLITQITRRQRNLQEMRALLQESAPQFQQYRQSSAYRGDTYPGGIGKLDALLKAYKPPEDAVGAALSQLKQKYNIKDTEI